MYYTGPDIDTNTGTAIRVAEASRMQVLAPSSCKHVFPPRPKLNNMPLRLHLRGDLRENVSESSWKVLSAYKNQQ